ncbi:44362_t:CDS:2, partial [Gigaspora margarita]
LTAVFLFVCPLIFMGIVTMWVLLKQKISNELSARVTKIKYEIADDLSARGTKIANELDAKNNTTITAEIERILTDVYRKLTTEINAKITNELPTRLSEINTELNSKLIAEITKINTCDAGYASEAQKIFNDITTRINNIEEACCNEFGRISSNFASIETLRNEMIQRYAIAQRLQVEFDQLSVVSQFEASNRSHESINSSSSRNSSITNSSLEESRNRFKRAFDLEKEIGDTMDYTFETAYHYCHA